MPIYFLIPLCIVAIFMPVLTGYVPARSISKPKIRRVIAPIGWTLGVALFTGVHTYGYSLHPDWWHHANGGMFAVVLVGFVLAIASMIGTARQSIYNY